MNFILFMFIYYLYAIYIYLSNFFWLNLKITKVVTIYYIYIYICNVLEIFTILILLVEFTTN